MSERIFCKQAIKVFCNCIQELYKLFENRLKFSYIWSMLKAFLILSIFNPFWLNFWVFVDELSGCGFDTINTQSILVKFLSVRWWTKWLWVRVPLLSLKRQISHLFQAKNVLTFRQLLNVDSFWDPYVTW